MFLDPENPVVRLCADGMIAEGLNEPEEARNLFMQAWDQAESDLEKLIAAHYLARQQEHIVEKLNWDKTALHFALKLEQKTAGPFLPSLYLNAAKCYEDLKDFEMARSHYQLAKASIHYLSDDGYGQLIRNAIHQGLKRVSE